MPLRNITYVVLSFNNGVGAYIGYFPSLGLAEADARARAQRNPGKEYAAVAVTRVFGAPQEVVERELQAPNDMGIGEDAQPVPPGWNAAPAWGLGLDQEAQVLQDFLNELPRARR